MTQGCAQCHSRCARTRRAAAWYVIHHYDPLQSLRNRLLITLHMSAASVSPAIADTLPRLPRPTPAATHPRAAAAPRPHIRTRQPLPITFTISEHCPSNNSETAFAFPPETPPNLRDFASRTQIPHPNTISPTAHPRTSPHSHRPKTQSGPYCRLAHPVATRDAHRNVANRLADTMGPFAASETKTRGRKGAARGAPVAGPDGTHYHYYQTAF